MPSRSRSRSYSRGRATKRYRSRSASIGSGMYAMAAGSRSRSASRVRVRARRSVRVQGSHSFSRRAAPLDEEMNGLYLARNYSYTFDMLQQSTEFTELFDNYRITMIELKIQMINSPNSGNPTNVVPASTTTYYNNPLNWYPKVWYVIDKDGGATETLATMRERQGVRCRILQPNKEIIIRFRPAVRTLTYTTATTQGFAPKNIKLDMADANVPHYGVNMVFDANGLDPNDSFPFKFRIERKFFFTCTGVR